MPLKNISRLIAFSSLILFAGSAIARQISEEKTYSAHDLDELMVKVWQNCKSDLDNLRGYIFNETDSLYGKKFAPHSSSDVRVQDRFDYVWTLKDRHLGPSLKSINGKEIPVNGKKLKITRKEYSLTWSPTSVDWYVNGRQKHPKWEKWDTILDFFDDQVEGWSGQRIYPRFDYKPREYTYVGSREYEGHHVIEITYPSSAAYVSLGTVSVRMLVIPDENQLVAVALSLQDNHTQDKGWKTEWTMTMDNSHDNVWLPKEVRQSGASSWGGEVSISREFNDYARTGVKAKFWFEDVKTRIWYDQEKPDAPK